jgi:endonuclease YncB( thermonuclease family)
MRFLLRPLALTCAALLVASCQTQASRRYSREEASALLKRLEVVSLELGEFPIDGASAVLDGDTIRVKGLSSTMRLLGIDTEEIFHHEWEKQAFSAGWEPYKKKIRGNSPRPVKMATPVGEDAKAFAQGFFEDVRSVRLERDHPGEVRDFYGRYLAYIFVKKNGTWVNYNVEAVRAGMSPYFMKYGRSRRFHKEFLEAMEEARAAQRGIWKPGAMHYDDYDERLKWWGEREKVITRFEKDAAEHPDDYVALTRWDALLKLEQKVGQEVVLLGAVQDVKRGEKGPSIVELARSRTSVLPVVFFDKDVLMATGLQFKRGEYVQIKGQVKKYNQRLQLVVSLPGQVLAPSTELKQLIDEGDKQASDKPARGDDQDKTSADHTSEEEGE